MLGVSHPSRRASERGIGLYEWEQTLPYAAQLKAISHSRKLPFMYTPRQLKTLASTAGESGVPIPPRSNLKTDMLSGILLKWCLAGGAWLVVVADGAWLMVVVWSVLAVI